MRLTLPPLPGVLLIPELPAASVPTPKLWLEATLAPPRKLNVPPPSVNAGLLPARRLLTFVPVLSSVRVPPPSMAMTFEASVPAPFTSTVPAATVVVPL